jgi:hypothetical protein
MSEASAHLSCNMNAMFLSEAHGANMDASGANDTRNLGLDESTETVLSLGACDSTMSRTVIVQSDFGKLRRATVIASSPAT